MNTLLAHADDLVILETPIHEIKSGEKKLFKAKQNTGLIVNKAKTKYIVMSKQVTQKNNLKVYRYSFEK